MLTNSLISSPGWAGKNGNINSNPLFVNAPAGDYHLTTASPAIDAGTTIGAPGYDLYGAPRDAQPDLGAVEYGAIPRLLLTVTATELGGSGTVTSNPAGINCGTATITARFASEPTKAGKPRTPRTGPRPGGCRQDLQSTRGVPVAVLARAPGLRG